MSLACDDLEHVAVVPGSLLAPATEAGLGASQGSRMKACDPMIEANFGELAAPDPALPGKRRGLRAVQRPAARDKQV